MKKNLWRFPWLKEEHSLSLAQLSFALSSWNLPSTKETCSLISFASAVWGAIAPNKRRNDLSVYPNRPVYLQSIFSVYPHYIVGVLWLGCRACAWHSSEISVYANWSGHKVGNTSWTRPTFMVGWGFVGVPTLFQAGLNKSYPAHFPKFWLFISLLLSWTGT